MNKSELMELAERREYFTPADVCGVLGTTQQTIRLSARAGKLDFPTVCLGCRVRIPAQAFIKFMGW